MKKSTPKLKIKKPAPVFEKPLRADFKALFKGLSKGVGHAVVGKWEELGNDTVETLSAIGLATDPAELASLLIRRSITRSLFDLVGEIAAQYLTEIRAESEKLEAGLNYALFEQDIYLEKKFLDQPEKLPVITTLQPLLKAWLEVNGVPETASSAVVDRLPSYFVYALNQEWRRNASSYQPLIAALETPFSKAGEREWAWSTYASLLEKRIHESVFDEPFSLAQLYVPLNAYYLEESSAKGSGDATLRSHKYERRMAVSLEEELLHWLARSDPIDAVRVISGGPGSGKSSFARIFAVRVTRLNKTRVLFVPLHLIDATKDLIEEVGRFTRDEGILTQNPLDPESPESNLLIIFDGLDELASQGKAAAETARAFIREIERTVEKRNLSGPRLRILVSGRELVVQENESEFRRPKQILNLLPYFIPEDERTNHHYSRDSQLEYIDPKNLLKEDLREQWWKTYGALSGHKFSGLPQALKRNDLTEVTAQPLLNYLVALSYTRGKIDFTKDINLNLIYSDLVAAVYQRGYERKRTYGPIRHMTLDQFNRVLEEVGLAAWHGDGRSTTVREIEDHCRLSGVGKLLEAFQDGAKAGVTRLLAAFFFRQHGHRASGDPTFVFTHKSFGEYLTARRVIRATDRVVREIEKRQQSPDDGWDEKDALRHWSQICGPSAVSPYLHNFLLNETHIRDRDEMIRWQAKLAQLFSFVLRHSLPIEQMQLSAFREIFFRIRNSEEALLVLLNACARNTRTISMVEHSDPTAFGAWFKRIQGQRVSAESGLAARCLSFLNLEGVFLDIADLYYANLEGSNLSNVAAHLACFGGANFRGSNISGSRLWKANLANADFSGAKMLDANLNEADLTHSKIDPSQVGKFRMAGALLRGIQPPELQKRLMEESKRQTREPDDKPSRTRASLAKS
jgi:uncharacterized protein YjbI with pentapeptide repeats